MPTGLTSSLEPRPGPELPFRGVSRSLALGRILHFEALMRRRLGEVRAQRYVRLHNYYAGQNLPPDNVEQPLLINYFKPIVDKHTGYLWGQYKNRLFETRTTPLNKDDLEGDTLTAANLYGRKIKRWCDYLYDSNKGNITFYQASKNSCLYGDGILKLRYDPVYRRIVIESVLPEYFHAVWNIANMHELEEVLIAYPIDRAYAKERYGTAGNEQILGYQQVNPTYLPGIGIYWEHWTTTTFQIWIDDHMVENLPNPFMPQSADGRVLEGIIPFIHVPNMQAGAEYWGYSDGEAILYLQDELNRRMADQGDIVNNHAHPIIALKNFTGNPDSLSVGPDALWDLGHQGEAARLEGTGPPPAVMDYINKVKEIMDETASMPSSAYGTHKGGTSHQSGLALALTMMPVVERAREKRIHWSDAMKRLYLMAAVMMEMCDPAMLRSFGIDLSGIYQYDISPVFADILPKDRLETINEGVARSANMLQSIVGALEMFGEEDVEAEYARIKADALFKAQVGAAVPPAEGGTAGKNSKQGQGGSNALPGGISASLSKPGTLIKSRELDSAQSDSTSLNNTL